MLARAIVALLMLGWTYAAVSADKLVIEMKLVNDSGTASSVGSVTLTSSLYGVILTPNLFGLPPGVHGFHLHENTSCGPAMKDGKMIAGLAAGSHFDPQQTRSHRGPYGDGHQGDLPVLYVGADGTAKQPILAPRLLIETFKGHAVVIHAGGDNYSDMPKKLGGGGARIACGIMPW